MCACRNTSGEGYVGRQNMKGTAVLFQGLGNNMMRESCPSVASTILNSKEQTVQGTLELAMLAEYPLLREHAKC